MRVAITGASGFLGKNLSNYLQMYGHSVRKLSHKVGDSDSRPVDYYNIEVLTEVLKDVDLLVHCAWTGVSSADRTNKTIQSINVEIAENMATSIKNTGVSRIIALGSQDEFGDVAPPWGDLTPVSPISAYGIAKNKVHEVFADTKKDLAWVRIFSTFGEGDLRDTIFLKVAKALKNDQVLSLGSCENLWSNCHIDDIVTGIALILNKEVTGEINLAPLNATSLKSQIEILIHISEKNNHVSFDSKVNSGRSISTSEGKIHELGWNPKVSLEDGFMRYWRWVLKSEKY